MRSSQFEYEPVWEFTSDWYKDQPVVGKIEASSAQIKWLSEIELGNFTLFCIDVCWEAGYFTFHIALVGFHIGRSLQIKY